MSNDEYWEGVRIYLFGGPRHGVEVNAEDRGQIIVGFETATTGGGQALYKRTSRGGGRTPIIYQFSAIVEPGEPKARGWT